MFDKSQSVSDYVTLKQKTTPLNYKSTEDKEYEAEKRKMNKKIKTMMD